MAERRLTDQEMLLICYGAMRAADDSSDHNFKDLIAILEAHLFPTATTLAMQAEIRHAAERRGDKME